MWKSEEKNKNKKENIINIYVYLSPSDLILGVRHLPGAFLRIPCASEEMLTLSRNDNVIAETHITHVHMPCNKIK